MPQENALSVSKADRAFSHGVSRLAAITVQVRLDGFVRADETGSSQMLSPPSSTVSPGRVKVKEPARTLPT